MPLLLSVDFLSFALLAANKFLGSGWSADTERYNVGGRMGDSDFLMRLIVLLWLSLDLPRRSFGISGLQSSDTDMVGATIEAGFAIIKLLNLSNYVISIQR